MSSPGGSRRASPRRLFVEPGRLLGRVYFYTSSIEKYLQARLVFDRHGLTVDYFKSKTEPYDEDYAGTTPDLLTKAISQITGRIGSGHPVFVEDTSLRLEALSEPLRDYPGMHVKDWFAATSFEDCDSALRAAGGDRTAVVKSDIALKIPGLDRPVLFHGETAGRVADGPPAFVVNPQYPWLTPETFNGWFVPDSCGQPLGALPLEEALGHDFRVRAFEHLIDRLEEYAAALNLPPAAYRRKRPLAKQGEEADSLFSTPYGNPAPALLVVGRTCAGKTTFAEHVSAQHGLKYIEASAVVRSLGVERLPADDPDGFAFAMRALDQLGHDIVAREIVRRYGDQLDGPFVVSGLRDVEELRSMRELVPRVKVVLVEASERTRFERHVLRARAGAELTIGEFRARDSRQDAFGLLPVVEDLADIRILNEGRVEEYRHQVDAVIGDRGSEPGVDMRAHPRHGPEHHQLYRCLKILQQAGVPLQCDEIEARSAELGAVSIRHNNANKVLRAVPALAQRLDPANGNASQQDSARVRYAITGPGATYLSLLDGRGDRFTSQNADD
ncbi:MAG: AAA family ATPase [Actinobacteria bacterium]|nr:AAA family ATPase [Actinomycetota bacterium]